MDRKDFLRKRKLRYVGGLLIIFILAFGSYAALTLRTTQEALFGELDAQYLEAAEVIAANPESSLENFLSGRNIVYSDLGSYSINYKIFILLRDGQGRLLNAEPLRYFDYLYDIGFSPPEGRVRIANQSIQRSGESVYYRCYVLPLAAGDGETLYVQLASEVTDLVRTTQAIRSSLLSVMLVILGLSAVASWVVASLLIRSFEEAWKRQDAFTAYAAHNLRTPLSIVHNSLELLLEDSSKRIIDRSEYVLPAAAATSHMRKITSDLLLLARLGASEKELLRETFDLSLAAGEIVTPLLLLAETGGKSLAVDIQPGLMLNAEKGLIEQLVVLLLENAIKYTEAGDSIRLSMSGDALRVGIQVRDTGIGVEDADMENLFSRFYRGGRAAGAAEGSGLGLSIASAIVTRHGGTIRAAHNSPKGMLFSVSLPTGLETRRKGGKRCKRA
ncbi:MAG: HAMP domain-containing sensor histidine kinase [Clostridia bacterium]|nr:HAMP domain-containing sensor histidine kinase [Clostridia bacterium]